MKTFAVSVFLLAASSVISPAQELKEMSLPWKSGQKVILNLKFAENISIEAWDKKEVLLKAKILINGGTLNHAHIMDSTLSDHDVTIETDFDEEVIGKSWCDCNGRSSVNFGNNKINGHQSICSEIEYMVYVPAQADLSLETITGDIRITNLKGSINAKSVSGAVNVTVPSGQKADVHLKTVMGTVTSHPNIEELVDGLKPMLARKLTGKLNGGGKPVRLESVTGNVGLESKP